jgi:kinesin family protein C2/C3
LSALPKTERPKDASGLLPLAAMKSQSARRPSDPAEQEQLLFEQRLCEDTLGVAVRKINQYGKANLRYVKCVNLDEYEARNSGRSISSRSAGSWGRRRSPGSRENITPNDTEKAKRALVWGKKKDVQIGLDKFTSVHKGKITDRARRNPSPSSRVLSILTKDPNHPSLDIEAPTRMDRDKFARAFARFLEIPLLTEDSPSVNSADVTPITFKTTPDPSASSSAAGDFAMPERETIDVPPTGRPPQNPKKIAPADVGPSEMTASGGFCQGAVAATSAANSTRDLSNNSDHPSSVNVDSSSRPVGDSSQDDDDEGGPEAILELKANEPVSQTEDGSVVSSLTGHGYDQELVEELHQALNDLRAELEESRAEAARAVKVAEQAIQSAERSSSAEWQNTVTHKAAETAAIAQKRSAEAIAKQRLAEERLESERRTSAFWRKQAEIAESEAGHLQTRAAAAEVQRAAFEEQIESERRLAESKIEAMKGHLETLHSQQLASIDETMERNRTLEIELQALRQELQARKEHVEDVENVNDSHGRQGKRRMKFGGRRKNSSETAVATEAKTLLLANGSGSNSESTGDHSNITSREVARLQAQTSAVRKQYEMLRKTTMAELESLPSVSKSWTQQVSQTLGASQDEIARLRGRLAVESASRRKLLHEVQDLRGIVRVYCRPRPSDEPDQIISTPSQETLVLHREKCKGVPDGCGPLSFEFDRIFDNHSSQRDVFMEIQDVLLSVLEGYKVCIMAYGQTGSGKTKTLLGDVVTKEGQIGIENHGVQLEAVKQLFSVAKQRSERFKDTFTLTIIEVHNERLSDLLVGTQAAVTRGQLVDSKRKSQRSVEEDTSSSKPAKLEIRTDLHGETVVQGSLSLEIQCFEEALEIWEEALANRRNRLIEQEVDIASYESSAHVIATLQITSANIATGHGTVGKLQFVDLAGSDLTKSNSKENSSLSSGKSDNVNLIHRSLGTLEEVALARSQFVRSVPYRNSTLTHLLRDSLEADTKVLLFTCISTNADDLPATQQALRFSQTMRQVNVGKATKHIISSP